MMWLTVFTCIAALGIAIFAGAALRTAQRAFDYSAEIEALLASTSQRVLEMEPEIDALRGQTTALFSRVDRLCLRQDRLETVTGKAGFNEAIAFARHGANARELIDTCGLSHGEARLVQVLYGSDIESDASTAQNKSSVIETH